jgi:hypothetical protein
MQVGGQAQETAKQVAGQAQEVGRKATDTTQEYARQGAQATKETAQQTAEAVAEGAAQARERGREYVNAAAEKVEKVCLPRPVPLNVYQDNVQWTPVRVRVVEIHPSLQTGHLKFSILMDNQCYRN